MDTKNHVMVSFVTVLALVVLSIASVSAFGSITSVEVSGSSSISGLTVDPGQTVPVQVTLRTSADATDVRVKVEVIGGDTTVSTSRFDVLANGTYIKTLNVKIPSNLDYPNEPVVLAVSAQTGDGRKVTYPDFALNAQRTNDDVRVLDVQMNNEVRAGENLAMDVVLRNAGKHAQDNLFVKVSIPALNVEKTVYVGDLSAFDHSDPNKEDAADKALTIRVPSNAPAGVYVVQVEAYNDDSSVTATKRVSIVGAASDTSAVVSTTNSKTFAVGDKAAYALTLVNSGDKIRIYELVAETSSGLTLNLADSVVIVPAGESKSVNFDAVATKEGRYNFAVGVYSDGELVKRYSFGANVETSNGSKGFAANTTVLLTVVLAVIFVVLLIVLIVLLTKKPEKAEEFGESYY